MITPEEFPYITSIHVNDCYAYQDFDIPLFDYKPEKPFSHLILTGKNGSGKSTILRMLNRQITYMLTTAKSPKTEFDNFILGLKQGSYSHWPVQSIDTERTRLYDFSLINPQFTFPEDGTFWNTNRLLVIYSYLEAKRNSIVASVSTVTKESDLVSKLDSGGSTQYFISQFKQYLVNRVVATLIIS